MRHILQCNVMITLRNTKSRKFGKEILNNRDGKFFVRIASSLLLYSQVAKEEARRAKNSSEENCCCKSAFKK